MQIENIPKEQLEKILKALNNSQPLDISEFKDNPDLRTAIVNNLSRSPGQMFVAHPSVGKLLRKVNKPEVKE